LQLLLDQDGDERASIRTSFLHYLEYAGFKAVQSGLSVLPLSAATYISALCWRLTAPKLFRHRRALSNLKSALPHLSDQEREKILAGVWDNLGRTSVEAFRLHEIADDKNSLTYNIGGSALAILTGEQPAIFVSLHAGNWEVPAIVAERFGKPLIGIYRAIDNPLIDAAVKKIRSRFYRGGIWPRGSHTIRRAVLGIRSGYSIAIMADLRDEQGDLVPFFGMPAKSTNFPSGLAFRYQLPIVAIRAIRLGDGRFRVDAEEIKLSSTGDAKVDIPANTARIQSHFEAWIRADPSSWMWGHRRWG